MSHLPMFHGPQGSLFGSAARPGRPAKPQPKPGPCATSEAQHQLLQDWPPGCVVEVVGDHPHAGARGAVRWPVTANGVLRKDFPQLVLVDFDAPRAGVRNCYARAEHLRFVELP